jgi:hypothetical protein
MKITKEQIKKIIQEELKSVIDEVAFEDLDLKGVQNLYHKRILNQIVKGEIAEKQDPKIQQEIKKAIKAFNFCVSNDHLSPEEAAAEHGANEFDYMFDRGGEKNCFDHASEMAFEILRMMKK